MDFFRAILETKTSFQLDSLGSNKLSRALIACVRMLYGVEGVENIKKSNFATSDLLLWTKEKGTSKKIFLLPKPIFPIEIKEQSNTKEQSNFSILKKYKKSKYITYICEECYSEVNLKRRLTDNVQYCLSCKEWRYFNIKRRK